MVVVGGIGSESQEPNVDVVGVCATSGGDWEVAVVEAGRFDGPER